MVGDRYRLLEPLGSGGMAVVWRAEDALLGREVAVKVLSAGVSADPAALRRIYAEARAAAGLRHDNVVEVYDYGETEIDGVPMPYVVMELVEGRTLSDMLTAGALPWRLAVLIGAQVAAALAAAHDRGVVHRDVKPANVMVRSGGVKLVDFGISAAVGELEKVSDQILGTPAYLAPERLAGGMVRPATDVYALGLLLYLMLAGRMPWNASTTTQMLRAHRYREPAPLPQVPDLPAELADLVRSCLAKAPSDRPAAVTVARRLRLAAGLPPLTEFTRPESQKAADTPTEPATVTQATAATATRRSRRALVAGALLAAAAVTIAFLSWPGSPEPRPAAAAATPLTCRVTYTTQITAGAKAVTAVTVANTGAAPVDSWTLSFRLPGEQRVLRGSAATWRQDGEVVRATGRALAAGGKAETSFDATYRRTVVLPQSFTVNDVVCGAEMSVRAPKEPAATVTKTKTVVRSAEDHRRTGKAAKKPPRSTTGGHGKGPKHPRSGVFAGLRGLPDRLSPHHR